MSRQILTKSILAFAFVLMLSNVTTSFGQTGIHSSSHHVLRAGDPPAPVPDPTTGGGGGKVSGERYRWWWRW